MSKKICIYQLKFNNSFGYYTQDKDDVYFHEVEKIVRIALNPRATLIFAYE